MPSKVAYSTLNATTLDILNVIRQNADAQYQKFVPKFDGSDPNLNPNLYVNKVGQVICGYPALANQFVSALVNRIAAVVAKSALFYNPYKSLKKGFLEYGETIEEVFVEIAKVREFSAEKAAAREFRRTLPDVKAAFHAINWQVQYPVTVQIQDLKRAFLSMDGVQELITKIIDSVYRAAEYDEFLLFKYVIIKSVIGGKMHPVVLENGVTAGAKAFRGMSNKLTFMKTDYNAARVHNVSPREDQYLFMDTDYNAEFDVDVLAASFHMDKSDFLGHLQLIDDFTSFDNERWEALRAAGCGVDLVTPEELELMKSVKAVLVDQEFFQFYDNLSMFTEQQVTSGLYWNYNYNVWKTISVSPYSNAVVFVEDGTPVSLPETITAKVVQVDRSEKATVVVLQPQIPSPTLVGKVLFTQVEDAVKAGVAVQPYGAFVFPNDVAEITPTLTADGTPYLAGTKLSSAAAVGTEFTFTKQPAARKAARGK